MNYDIHHYSHRLRRIEDAVRKDESIDDDNKLAILKFVEFCQAEGLAAATILKHVTTLRHADTFLKKSFESANADDIVRVSKRIEEMKWTDTTKRTARVTLKKFYKWLRKTEYYPDEVRWIKTSQKSTENHLPDILSEEEVLKLVTVAETPRDKALVMTLYESGCRVGEILTMNVGSVSFNDVGASITVNGKTGSRRILLIASAPHLATWLAAHPMKDDPNAALWLTKFNHIDDAEYSPLGYAAVNKLLNNLRKKARISKRIYPHLFRHTRATHLANKLTEAQMKQLFGWTPDSKMAGVYVHLSGRDVDNALLELHGLANQTKTEPKLKLKICPRCNEHNSPDAKYCKRCAFTLDVETMEWENKMMDELIKQPRVANYLRKVLAQVVKK